MINISYSRGYMFRALTGLLTVLVFVIVGATSSQADTTFQGFRGPCTLAFTGNVDPVALTNHKHNIWGNKGLHNSSTYYQLQNTESTCRRPADKSGYWAPQLMWNGKPLTTNFTGMYAQTLGSLDPRDTQRFPLGHKMVINDATKIEWACGVHQNSSNVEQAAPTYCENPEEGLGVKITFPSCWDGVAKEGAANMAYPTSNGCPTAYPHQLPTLTLWPDYKGLDSQHGEVTLALGDEEVGDASQMHADVMIGYDTRELVNDCIRLPANGHPRPDYCDGNLYYK